MFPAFLSISGLFYWLVVSTILKMMEFVNGKDDIPYIVENKTCSKPPISLGRRFFFGIHFRDQPEIHGVS